MNVIVPAISGFCPGVKNAEEKLFTLKAQDSDTPMFIFGNLINNRKYIEYLEAHGIHSVSSPEAIPAGATVIIRTHGLNRKEEEALRSQFKIIDLTCGKVKKVHGEIERHAAAGYVVVIVGSADHPETRGHVSYAGECYIISGPEECGKIMERITCSSPSGETRRVFLCAQTTAERSLFADVLACFKKEDGRTIALAVYDSICSVTERKQKEALRLQKNVDISFVVGDAISSNATKLYRALSADKEKTVYFIEDVDELKRLGLPLRQDGTALVVSSASTPPFIENAVVEYLRGV